MKRLSQDTRCAGRDSNRAPEDNELRALPLRQPAPFVRPLRATRVYADMGLCLNLTGLTVVQNSLITFQRSSSRGAATAHVALSPHR
jgi:hypothetical protein